MAKTKTRSGQLRRSNDRFNQRVTASRPAARYTQTGRRTPRHGHSR